VSSESELPFNFNTSLFRVYKDNLIEQKSLRFLSDVNGVKTTEVVDVESFWEEGSKGQGVKIAILDSGFSSKDEKFIKISECVDFTDEGTCEDQTGHGTAVASIIGSLNEDCPGLAPHSEIHSLKVFNKGQESKTSWFLEAFEYVIQKGIKIVNLSSGGINYLDEPFVTKIKYLVSQGVVVVSAAGNDGPGLGTLSNPGDQAEVIGVGGLDETGVRVAEFSSRGPTLWEINDGMGRFKPDLVTFSTNIKVFYKGECISKTGTSIATPIVSAAVALLQPNKFTPGAIKIALLRTADRLDGESIFDQGAGKMNLEAARIALNVTSFNEIQTFPEDFDNTLKYFYPFNLQPVYMESPPIVLNFSVFHSSQAEERLEVLPIKQGRNLKVTTEVRNFEAYTASLSVFIYAKESFDEEDFEISIKSGKLRTSINFKIKGGRKPAKNKRILWDLSHNAKFPESGAVIRDELEGLYLLDWRGDHPFTNHLELYELLVKKGYIVDFLLSDFSGVRGELYSSYLIIDPEKDFTDYQIKKIQYDLEKNHVNLMIFADWSDEKTLQSELKKSNFQSGVAGCNILSLNKLLSPYFIELSTSKSFSDTGRVNSDKFSVIFNQFAQGSELTRFPAGGFLVTQVFQDPKLAKFRDVAVVGLASWKNFGIGISGDSSCLDGSSVRYDCLWIVVNFLEFFQSRKSNWENYLLPYDYDIHVEEEVEEVSLNLSETSAERMKHLMGDVHVQQEVDDFEPESHVFSLKKIRVWGPLREIEPVDIVGVVYIATILIFALLFLILFYARSRTKPSVKMRPLAIHSENSFRLF
jgi:membrane-bound transcription factor site-1 protease